MARLLARSSSQRFVYASGSIVVAYPFTFGCRARFASKPSSSSMWMMGCFKSGGSGVDNGHYFGWENSSNQNEFQAVSTTNDDWTTNSKTGAAGVSVGQWFNIAAGFYSATDRNLYLNGNFAGSDGISRAFGTPDQFIIGAYLSGAGTYVATFDGDIADAFILSRGATDAELDAFNAGFSPLDIWPASDILEYIPMLGSSGDEVGYKGRTFVQAGTGSIASSPHPNTGLYYPVRAPSIELIVPAVPSPVIDSVTPDAVQDGTEVVISGSAFGAAQGSGKVEIGDDSDYGSANLEEATVIAWADDEITAEIVQGMLANGPVWLFVTDDDGNTSDGFALTLGILDFHYVGTIDLELDVSSPSRVESHFVGNIDLELDFAELPRPPALDFHYVGTIDLELETEAKVRTFGLHRPGLSTVTVYRPTGVVAGTLTPLRYRISRYENQVGEWECELPVDEDVTDSVPIAALITYGWKISIQQENFNPDHAPEEGYLLYQGIVETREHRIGAGGETKLALTGSFRTYELVRRSVLRNLEYDGNLLTVSALLAGGFAGGPIYYDAARLARTTLKGTFTDLSRYAAWVKAATLGRHAIRESWDHDRPEIVPYDGPPDSNIVFRPLNPGEDRYQHANGGTGVALISGTPVVKFDGSNLVNRIIPKGVDTITDPEDPESLIDDVLTLQHASLNSPYPKRIGVNPDGTPFYYIEDTESVTQYGLTEVVLTFSDVRNPNDDSVSRTQAANVLYMRAVNEMIKRRSENLELTFAIANGSEIWALPGDSAMVEYHGEVQTESGAAVWLDLEKRMLITQRVEESHPSGVRRVAYQLKAPVMEFPVPGLPGEISLPPPDDGGPNDPNNPDTPGSESCCPDPDDNQNQGPEDEFGDNFPEPEPVFGTWVRDPQVFIVTGGAVNSVPWNRRSSGTLEPNAGWNIYTLPNLGPGSFSVSGQALIFNPDRDGNWTVRLVINGVPGDPLLSGSNTTFVPTGGDNRTDGVTPTVVANGLSAGTVVWMEFISPAGPSIRANIEGHITITFTPSS